MFPDAAGGIPPEEALRFVSTLADALRSAYSGAAADGFRRLRQAEAVALAFERAGQPWGAELAHRYRTVLAGYTVQFGPRLLGLDEPVPALPEPDGGS